MKNLTKLSFFILALAFGGFGFTSGGGQGEAPCTVKVDFQTGPAGEPMPAGTVVAEQWAGFGLHISALNNNRKHPSKVLIFDSSNPSGGDSDLGTPNQAFGGPGKGEGGAKGVDGANKHALGNLLIISENDKDNNGDGLIDNPDDEASGGQLLFNWDMPVLIEQVMLVDLDDGNDGSVMVFESEDGKEHRLPIPALGNNSVKELQVNVNNVTTMRIDFAGSGSVAYINFCPEPK